MKTNISFSLTLSILRNIMRKPKKNSSLELWIIWVTCLFVKIIRILTYPKMPIFKKE